MTIQDLLDKVSEAGVSLWDLKTYGFSIKDEDGNTYRVSDIKIDENNKKIKIKIE